MCNQQNSSSLLRQSTHRFSQLPLRGDIQSVARLVQQKNPGPMHDGSTNQDAFRLSRRHLTHRLVAKVLDLQQMKNFIRALPHLWSHMEMRPQSRARKETRHHRIATRCWEVRSPGSSVATTPRYRRNSLRSHRSWPKMRRMRACPHQWIALAGESLDQRGFSATIRSQDRNMFLLPHAQRNIVQHDGIAARHGNISHFNKQR